MPPPALHAVFQSTAMAKVTYAAPAWWGFTNVVDRNRLEAFIRRHGYRADTTPTLSSLCDKADQALFDNIMTVLTLSTSYFHPKLEKHYSTRPRGHCYQLPRKTSVLYTKTISFVVYYIVTFFFV